MVASEESQKSKTPAAEIAAVESEREGSIS